MYWINFEAWSHYFGTRYLGERVFKDGHKWTPIIKIKKRKYYKLLTKTTPYKKYHPNCPVCKSSIIKTCEPSHGDSWRVVWICECGDPRLEKGEEDV